ncbi:MAG: Uma2 family endonuclease [Pyrinomonadaceae bacterium]|nr:Uma2 family endonuclease [Pyrinomonadaceae bacterium]
MLSINSTCPIVINVAPLLDGMSDDDFLEFCHLNRELRIERTKEGNIIIMPPTSSETGNRNFNLTVSFGIWARQDGTGKGFDSSTGFQLPNGAKRSPDLAWVRNERWEALSAEERKRFAPLCPDFVVELRSTYDSLAALEEKMKEYIANGAQLGWLIDPAERKIYIYRPNAEVEALDDPQSVSGEPLLKGFVLNTRELFV